MYKFYIHFIRQEGVLFFRQIVYLYKFLMLGGWFEKQIILDFTVFSIPVKKWACGQPD